MFQSGGNTKQLGDQLVTAAEIDELLGISSRTVLLSPLRRIQLGPKTIRFRLRDVYEHFGLDEPEISG